MPGHANQGELPHLLLLERKFSEYEPALQDGVRELRKAYELAVDANRDKWDFAVELPILRRFGLTESDFRWLVCKGIVEHAFEVAAKEGNKRKFRPTKALKFKHRTCFVLTKEFAQKVIGHDATVVALHPEQRARDNVELAPQWDGGRHELYLADFLVKRYRWPAKNQETVLTAFAEEQWPDEGVDDPLPPHADTDPKQRLRDTIKCLNRNQAHRLIRFRGDGTGERVIWEFTPKAIELIRVDRSTKRPA